MRVSSLAVVFAQCANLAWAGTREAISPSEFSKYWSDPEKIVANLDDYQALWIQVHNCV